VRVTYFSSPAEELQSTQAALDQLLREVAGAQVPISEHTISRLEKLANACSRLAYPNNLPLSEAAHNLVTWCDHLNELAWRARFADALKSYPLRAPW